jgi:hypothetical protein
MTRAQLEHVIRAAADIADVEDIVVIGSPAILGQFPDASASMRVSTEADIYPLQRPERADLIEGSIGELSPVLADAARMLSTSSFFERTFDDPLHHCRC